jgi:coenzyme F420-dependent glucose-6-phosphate dehydrogenase
MIVSYHASQEQFTPKDLLTYAVLAEEAGFDACHSSDHFHPWSTRQGQSGYTFAWLGAAMQATKFPFSMVNAPGQRYHPAIVAQAIATLNQMYPGRLDVAFGSGEALNEKITGEEWPDKSHRNQRLLESVTVIRRLMKGETVTHSGHIKVSEATLYTRPERMPLFMGAALTEETARWLGSWADGLLMPFGTEDVMQRMMNAFREGGGSNKPIHVQIAFSYARTFNEALEEAHHQWRSNTLPHNELGDLYRPEHFDEKAAHIKPEDMKDKILVTSSLEQCADLLVKAKSLGVQNIILHNVSRQQELFIKDFGETVLPMLREEKGETII